MDSKESQVNEQLVPRSADTKVSHDLSQQIRGVAVVIMDNGLVVSMDRPARHHHILHALAIWARREIGHGELRQGFQTMTGKFIDREAAARLCGRKGQLFSEDLW